MAQDDHRFDPHLKVAENRATRVNRLRIKRGFTQQQLAARCRLSTRTISRLMQDEMCAVRAHVRVAQELGADVFDLWPNLITQFNAPPPSQTRTRRSA